jgi:hypothetical protein
MLTMRQEQVEAFRQHHLQKFEDEMVEHLKGFAPEFCEIRGEACMRRVIGLGIDRAQLYGFTNRGPVRFYIELMLTFGSDFDTDFQLPWVGEILRQPESGNQAIRAERLFGRLNHYAEQVFGPQMEYAIESLRRAELVNTDLAEVAGPALVDWLIARMKMIYPQKCLFIGDSILRRLVEDARGIASTYDMTSNLGIASITVLMFGVGYHVTTDVLYPWVGATLTDDRIGNGSLRAERLYRKATTYCKHVLANLEAK